MYAPYLEIKSLIQKFEKMYNFYCYEEHIIIMDQPEIFKLGHPKTEQTFFFTLVKLIPKSRVSYPRKFAVMKDQGCLTRPEKEMTLRAHTL